MPVRATVADIQNSRYCTVLGLCSNNLAEIIPALNECTQRLLQALGNTPYVKVAFNVNKEHPYLTLPRQFARMINMDYCRVPMRIHNQFYEYLPGGIGLQDGALSSPDWCGNVNGYERDTAPTIREIDPTNQLVRVYATNSTDIGKQVLITGLDQNGLYWLRLGEIAEHGWIAGRQYNADVWHQYCRRNIMPNEITLKDGTVRSKWLESPDGVMETVSTTQLEKTCFSEYIRAIEVFGAQELGVHFSANPRGNR